MFEKITNKFFGNADEALRQKQEIEVVRDTVLRKFPLLGVKMSKLETVAKDSVGTAGTDGKTIYYSPKYFATLTDEEKVFVYAHEVMHVAFNHILRSKDRDHKIWNQATDSVINHILKNENLPMDEGGVDIEEALHHSAEEMYEKLLKEKEEKQKEKEQQKKDKSEKGEPEQSDDGGGDSDEDESEQAGHDNHDIWKEAVKQYEKEQEKKKQQSGHKKQESKQKEDKTEQVPNNNQSESGQTEQQSDKIPHKPDGNTNQDQNAGNGGEQRDFGGWSAGSESEFEKGFEEQNKQEKATKAAEVRAMLNREKNRAMAEASMDSGRTFGEVGKSGVAVNWKTLLKRSIETEQDRWSTRRANSDNDYMSRVEEVEDEDKAETEVLLDTSGSVSDEFLREFLRQLKPLLKDSEMKVGCFDHRFHPFVEVKTDKDIDNYKIPNKGNTDWDLAVKSFTPKKHINKIVFTDGETPGRMPSADTKNTNVIWIVYGNEEFNPVCGKIIRVRPKQIEQNYLNRNLMARKMGTSR